MDREARTPPARPATDAPDRVVFATPYPTGTAPSQRFRFEHYLGTLRERGMHCEVLPFWDRAAWRVLYRPRAGWARAAGVVRGLWRRLRALGRLRRAGVVFVHREMMPLGPPVLEWLVARLWRRPFVYDFDDAIWLPEASGGRLARALRGPSRVERVCRWATVVSCGNAFLADYARRYNARVVINPTVVDTVGRHNRVKRHGNAAVPVVGWTGTHSTLGYLDALVDAVRAARAHTPLRFVVIADRPPALALDGVEFVPWRPETEIDDLLGLDVGVMPLPDTTWARGKCAFKAIQYMALGIPVVTSDVGMAGEVVEHGTTGYVCRTAQEWTDALVELVTRPETRALMGEAGRRRVEERYSVTSAAERFAETIASAARASGGV